MPRRWFRHRYSTKTTSPRKGCAPRQFHSCHHAERIGASFAAKPAHHLTFSHDASSVPAGLGHSCSIHRASEKDCPTTCVHSHHSGFDPGSTHKINRLVTVYPRSLAFSSVWSIHDQ